MNIWQYFNVVDFSLDIWKVVVGLLLSVVAGVCIGIERSMHSNEAGIRAHAILGLASCMLMIISNYAFIAVTNIPGVSFDPSRVASTVVTGLGIIVAGVIFHKGYTPRGVTTAVGLLVTIAVGMCFGSGLFILGIIGTIVCILIQSISHIMNRFPLERYMVFTAEIIVPNKEYLEKFNKTLFVKKIISFRSKKDENGNTIAVMQFITTRRIHVDEILTIIEKDKNIKMLEKSEEI
ncbi:MAG: MgtC/SapB family protein [Clostridia bacterium]|nr:MgtC/SapB family protein [Clostridia bacterium]